MQLLSADCVAHVQIVHRDIKTSNILLARDGTAKLADVGLAKILRNDFLSTLQGQLGTFAWAAPEILLGRECSEKVDIYRCACFCASKHVVQHTLSRALRAAAAICFAFI